MVNRLGCNTQNFFKYKRVLTLWGVVALLLLLNGNAFAQTDTEFWFSIPETNRHHNYHEDKDGNVIPGNPSCNMGTYGTDVWLKFTSMELESTIQILRPGYPEGQRLLHEFTMGPNSFEEIYVGQWVNDGATTMENRLKYTESDDPTGGYDFINRSDKGIQIRATTPVTVYYEISLPYNKDLLSLKGRNALGKKFYVPFQNRFNNSDGYSCDERQYNSFDIVATDDAVVRITTPFNVFVWPGGVQAAGTFIINLKKGQTAIIAPHATTTLNYKVSRAANQRLTGSLVEVIAGGDIAVITKDDLVKSSTSVDYVADQLVPIEHIGTDYVVMKGKLTGNDYAYVVATEDDTRIYVNDVYVTTIDAGDTHEVILTNFSTAIRSSKIGVDGETANKPVYVYHLSGYGAQFAGALIPTISTCTGSSQVAFSRSTGGSFGFDINIMARVEAVGHFVLFENGVNVTSTLGDTLGINDPANFSNPPGTYHPDHYPDSLYSEQWQVAQFNANALTEGNAYLLKNTGDVFHLGVLNGDGGADAFYGYFSNFNTFAPKGIVVSTGFAGEALCAGESRQLYASGGTWYQWERADGLLPHYLDKTDIPNPIAGPLVESVIYNVDIGGACGLSQVEKVELLVGDAYAEIEVVGDNFACVDNTKEHTFTLRSNSTGDYRRTWEWRVAGATDWDPSNRISGNDSGIGDDAREVNITLENNTAAPIQYEVRLVVSDFEINCNRTATVFLMVYPYLDINPSRALVAPTNCEPLEVNFLANTLGEDAGAKFFWDFKDGNTASTQNASNIYLNKTDLPISYIPTLTVSNWGDVCSVTKSVPQITVQPFIKAEFTAKPAEGCSPLQISDFANNSRGGISSYSWTLTRMHDNEILGTSIDDDPTDDFDIQTISSLLVNSRTDNTQEVYRLTLVVQNAGGCQDVFDQLFYVSPNPTVTGITVTPTTDSRCAPLEVNYEATGLQNVTWMDWKVNGSSIGTTASGSHTLYNDGAVSVDKTFRFEASNSWGCSITPLTTDVRVQPFVEASFTLSTQEGCTPLAVTFTNNSSAGSSTFEWNVDGTTYPNAAAIPASFTNPNTNNTVRTIQVTLTARNSEGCEHTTDVRNIIVYPRATASFSASFEDVLGNSIPSGDPLCAPVTGDFTGTYQNATLYNWDFGVLGISTEENPTGLLFNNTTNAIRTFPVTLVANNEFNCPSNPQTQTYTVYPEVNANFNIDNIASCVPYDLEVSIDEVLGVSYLWRFNTETSTDASPTFNTITQNQTGGNVIYDVELTATGLGGCSNTQIKTVTIYPEVQAQWNFTAPTDYCAPLNTATFTNSSNLFVGGAVSNIQWEVFDEFGSPVVSSSLPSFTPLLTNPSHTSQKDYTIRLTATSDIGNGGCTDINENTITVDPRPLANFNMEVVDECTPTVIHITNTSITTGPNPYDWDWDTNGTTPNENADPIVVTYTNTDEDIQGKWIELEVTNEYGCKDYRDDLLEVYPQLNSAINLLSNTRDDNCDNDFFSFENQATEGESIREWRWLVHNTTTGTSNTYKTKDFEHTFRNFSLAPHDISITLTAENHLGCTEDATHNITVFPRVVAAQNFDIGDICGGDVDLTLTNSSSNVGTTHGSAIPTFTWTFTPNTGDPDITSDGSTPAVLVNTGQVDPVDYTVHFRAQTQWNNYNGITRTCWDETAGNTVRVYPELDPIYDIPPAVCSGLTGATLEFNKNASSSGGGINDVSLQWDFGDGNTQTTGFVNQVTKDFTNLSDADFTTSTKIFATQLATGCTANREVNVIVHPKVESIFTFEIGDVCDYPLPVTFTNAAKYSKQAGVTTQFHWDYGYGGEEDTFNASSPLTHTHAFTNANPNQIVEYDVVFSITQTHPSGRTCANTSTRKIQVYPEMLPSFNLPTTEGCNPLTVSFSNTSTGVNLIRVNGTPWNGQFLWDLGNGTTSNSITPATRDYAHTDKTKSLLYDINLTATNPLGCVKTATTSTPRVTVYPWVESWFTVDRIEGCTPLDVTLSNTFKSDEYAYLWNFVENGTNASTNSSDLEEPGTITFTNPLGATDELLVQKPQIQLKTSLDPNKYSYQTDEAGCVKTATPIEVSVFPHVYPDFEATLEGCHPLEDVEFTNTSNVFGETNNGEYTWDFDNGVQSNVLDPTQTFRNPDFVKDTTFNVKLTAESQHGCIDDTIKTVTVYPKPKARIELGEYMGCSPFDLYITNSSVGKGFGSSLEFTFDFGDGSDPHVTTDPGDPEKPLYQNLNNEIEPYTLSLFVETEDGCTDETSQTIHVYPEVTAIFDTDDGLYEHCNPFDVTFVNNSKNAWSYLWDFDDGGITSSSVAPNYRFVNDDITDRTYDVTLTAMSEFDCEDTDTLAITVFAAPIVDFVIMPPHQVFPQDGTLPVVYFKNLSRPKGIPHTWPHKWTFGDGDSSISTEETIEHTYEHWGPKDEDFRYEVTLAISNEKCADTLSQKFTILPPEPISLFSANEYRACSPLEVNFYNESLFYLTDEDTTAFEWRKDGEEEPFSTEYEPSYTFTEPGYHNVGLTVYGDGGERHFFKTFRVYENPVAMFEAMPERVTLPNAKVHFYNLSQQADSSIWVFGDNSLESTEWDPVHIYREMGEYQVSLTVLSLNDDGTECVDIYTKFPAVWVLGSGKIRFPNAFVPSKLGPNGGAYDAIDYKNEVFHPVAEGVTEYRLSIFNRWGEQVFESKDINIGWDGYYKGKLASQDVYVWRAVGRFANGDMFDERGNVTLLR